MPGVEIESIGFDLDHLHMLLVIPPKYSISEVMGRLKGQSASRIRKKFKWFEKVYSKENVVWSSGYFVSSLGLHETEIRRYVEYQGKNDPGQLQLEL